MLDWIPIVKVVLPYIAPIFEAALPAFTKRKSDKADPVINQQINELQEAVKKNAESITALAKALEEAVKANDQVMRRTRLLAVTAIGVATISLALSISTYLR
ncbi:MAG TPA: hypothetical protein VK629_05550 [Steroidobacteraceae bacterium]|nr:hypothetical protein [Steroidobacteraceae bacterium]